MVGRYYVNFLAAGTGGLINGGFYFYHRHNSPFVVRYNLDTEVTPAPTPLAYQQWDRRWCCQVQIDQEIPGMAHKDCPQTGHDFVVSKECLLAFN